MPESPENEDYIPVTRERIREIKSDLRKQPYSEVVAFIEKPHNVMVAQLVEGTRALLYLGNILILLAKLLPLAAGGLLVFVGWKSALAVGLAWGFMNLFRSELNLEIAARSVAASQEPVT